MSQIVAALTVDGFFLEMVSAAFKTRNVKASSSTESYLVSLLADYTKPDFKAERTLDQPLTLLLDEALHTMDLGERFDRLRALGDGVLYGMGFFSEHFESRGVNPDYLIGIGAKAYGSARSLLTPSSTSLDSSTDVFGELASNFRSLAGVIAEVADTTVAFSATTSKGLLRAYERWLKTGSGSLGEALREHGLHARAPGRTGSMRS
jgi:hypothetical protein